MQRKSLLMAAIMATLPSAGQAETGVVDSMILQQDTAADTSWFSTRISRKLINSSGATSIPELLRMIPGMVSSTPFGSYRMSTYMGMTDEYPRRMRIEIDGVPVNVASTGSVFWGALPFSLEDIESIDFVANPSSSVNGDQAFNGVLKINTIQASSENNQVSYAAGGKDYRRGYARLATSVDNLSLQVTASKITSLGEHQEVSSEDRSKFWISSLYTPNSRDTVVMNFGVGNARDDEKVSELEPQYPAYEDRSVRNVLANFKWEHVGDGVFTLSSGLNHVENDMANLVNGGTMLFDTSYDSTRYFASADYERLFDEKKGRFSVALNQRLDIEKPNTWSYEDEEWESALTELLLSGGYRLGDYTFTGGLGLFKHSDYENVETAIDAGVSKAISDDQSISLLYSQGVRFPVNWEAKSQHYVAFLPLDMNIFRNESTLDQMKPERVNSLSLGYEFKPTPVNRISARLFANRYEDLAYSYYTTPTLGTGLYSGQVISSSSGDRLDVNGLEVSASWAINKSNTLMGAFTRTNAVDYDSNVNARAESTPQATATLGWFYEKNGTSLGVTYSYVSDIQWEDVTANEKKSFDGYTTASVKASHCMNPSDSLSELCFSGVLRNVLEPDSSFYNDSENAISDTQLILKADYRF
jgi:outer membrane cobalamin receptor